MSRESFGALNFLLVKLGEPVKDDLYHRCYFKVMRNEGAWRITRWPVRLAIRLRVYQCACGKTFASETDEVIR